MFTAVNGVRLFYDVLGEKLRIEADGALTEKPTLIALHGGPGGDHQSLRPQLDRFAARCQIVYLDQRGGGRSDHGPTDKWTLDQWADDVAALCGALGVGAPILLGVSGGAMVAANCLVRHPGLARAAILVNACARLELEALVAEFERRGGAQAGSAARNMYSRGALEDLGPFMRHCLPLYGRRAPVGLPPDGARATFNFAVSQYFFNDGGEAFRFDFRERLGAVTCPVLALVGAHDPITQPQWGAELAAALPPGVCQHVLFEDASHAIASDEPARFFHTVEAFIDRIASPALADKGR